MRLDASYDLCSKLGSKLIFDEIMAILVLQDHFPILTAFLRGIFFRVRPDTNIFAMIYSHFKKKNVLLTRRAAVAAVWDFWRGVPRVYLTLKRLSWGFVR